MAWYLHALLGSGRCTRIASGRKRCDCWQAEARRKACEQAEAEMEGMAGWMIGKRVKRFRVCGYGLNNGIVTEVDQVSRTCRILFDADKDAGTMFKFPLDKVMKHIRKSGMRVEMAGPAEVCTGIALTAGLRGVVHLVLSRCAPFVRRVTALVAALRKWRFWRRRSGLSETGGPQYGFHPTAALPGGDVEASRLQ
jgi:hypothetical protein